MKIKTLLLLGILFCSTISRGQYMMMTLEGIKQGKFKGESYRSGSSQKIEVLDYIQEVRSPRDAATGLPTGKRQHLPITIWKASGASSPQFFNALIGNETIKTITIEFFKPDEIYTSTDALYYKIEFTNATISGYRQIMGIPEVEGFKARSLGLYDEIKFTFEKITVSSMKVPGSATDGWRNDN